MASTAVINAVLEETTTVPPKSEVEVRVSALSLETKSGTWLLEDHLSKTSRQGMIAARAVVTPNSHVVTHLINLMDTPSTLRKGTKIATLIQLPDDSVQAHVSVSSDVPDSKHTLLWEIAHKAEHLTEAQRDQLYFLLLSYSDLFACSNDELGRTGMVTHTIHTGDASPVRTPPRRLPKRYQEEASKLLQQCWTGRSLSHLRAPGLLQWF